MTRRDWPATAQFGTTADLGVLDALDFPHELQPLQDAYWKARRDWKELEAAYLKVALHMLSSLPAPPDEQTPS